MIYLSCNVCALKCGLSLSKDFLRVLKGKKRVVGLVSLCFCVGVCAFICSCTCVCLCVKVMELTRIIYYTLCLTLQFKTSVKFGNKSAGKSKCKCISTKAIQGKK